MYYIKNMKMTTLNTTQSHTKNQESFHLLPPHCSMDRRHLGVQELQEHSADLQQHENDYQAQG